MSRIERVTVSLPAELVAGIDRWESNRSRFVAQAIEHELVLRRRRELMRSVENPHPESEELAASGMGDWEGNLPAEDEDLVEPKSGNEVRWVEGEGWVEETA